ncbi:hypothetical protein [Amycolatopsis nigrescens]|uniref:hypothetical protein n=1 Tax=Amycolatopsis nigrescens TaxID=381445 RepID=UPI00035DD8EC|nr:hypothetical protein [Amycolatopsis nigrescens]
MPSTPPGFVHRLPADNCEAYVPADELTRLLKETVQLLNDNYSGKPEIGHEFLTCRWTGTSRIPDKDIGVYSRTISLTFERTGVTAAKTEEEAIRQAGRSFEDWFSPAKWRRVEVHGTDRAARHNLEPERSIILGLLAENVRFQVDYSNPDLPQEQVEKEGLGLAAMMIDQLKR